MAGLKKMRGKYYIRVRKRTGYSRSEMLIPTKTRLKSEAIARRIAVEKYESDIKDGTIQEFQFKELFGWLNDKGTTKLIKKSLQDVIDEYLEYRECSGRVRENTIKKDGVVFRQFTRLVGTSIPADEITYKHIEGKNGLIKHLQDRGCTNVGINITLRHLKVFLNWMHDKEKIISEPIKFKMLPEGEQLYRYFNEPELNAIQGYYGVDEFYKKCFYFYSETGMRPSEPFLGELAGDWYLIDASQRKNKIPMQMKLNPELKSMLIEMQSFRDTFLEGRTLKGANERAYDILCRQLMKVVRSLGFTGKKLTLYSFRHTYAIRRVTTTDIYQVQREMGHTSTNTTQKYLRFPEQRRLDDFPSLKAYIEKVQYKPENAIRVADFRVANHHDTAVS